MLRHLRQYVTNDCFRSLVLFFVHSRLDYGNSILVGLPAYLQRRLQAVLNDAARHGALSNCSLCVATTILHRCPRDITLAIRFPEQVNFKFALMAYRVQRGMAPAYLNQLVPVSDLPGQLRLPTRTRRRTPHHLSLVGTELEPI